MHRLAVRDDHVLQRKLKQGAQRRQCSLLMRRRSPTAQLAFRGRQPVGENRARWAATAASRDRCGFLKFYSWEAVPRTQNGKDGVARHACKAGALSAELHVPGRAGGRPWALRSPPWIRRRRRRLSVMLISRMTRARPSPEGYVDDDTTKLLAHG